MSTNSRWLRVLALLLGFSLLAAACGDDDDEGATPTTEGGGDEDGGDDDGEGTGSGGEFVDGSTFVGDPPEHLDPALNTTLNAYQAISALYDGLTEIDFDPEEPEVKPLLAEEVESNEDGSVWTFTIKEGMVFSNGEEILPSTFKRSWERAAALAGDYSYLMQFIEGGAEALETPGTELTGVVADDEAMTLEVTLAEPYSNFDAVAGFQLFYPMPEEAGDKDAPVADYENGVMIGNGPYAMESARTDEEIVLVKNDEWAGDINGETHEDRLDRIIFRVQADPDTAYNAFEAGEVDSGQVPPARLEDARENYGNTTEVNILGSYHYLINQENPMVGGDENVKLRQAISAAIDRDQINQAVYNGARQVSTGVVPPGIPGFEEGICDYCSYDPEQAQQLFDEWQEEGGSLDGPIPIQINADAGHEDVVQILIDNLKAIGIDAQVDPRPTETYFTEMADGQCVICRAGWFADYPTYDNFMYDLFHTDSIEGNNYAKYSDEEFDGLVDEAKQTVDADEQKELFNQAEDVLLNDDTVVIPLNWYLGDKVFDDTEWEGFDQTNQGLVLWERIRPLA